MVLQFYEQNAVALLPESGFPKAEFPTLGWSRW